MPGKVLVLSYFYPPNGAAKTRRLVLFLKYFARFSWQPVVLTAKLGTFYNLDPSLVRQIPSTVRVFYTRRVSGIFGFQEKKKVQPTEKGAGVQRRGVWRRMATRAMEEVRKWGSIPDAFVDWLPSAFWAGTRLCKSEEIDLLYATGPPFSNHLLGVFLKCFSRKPLVVDFRDGWISDPVRKWRDSKGRWSLEKRLEGLVVRRADRLIVTTEGLREDLLERYPSLPGEKVVYIPNGFDPSERPSTPRPLRTDHKKLRIVHTGFLGLERSPRTFLLALSLFLNERPEAKGQLEVRLMGESARFSDGKSLGEYISDFELKDVVHVLGPVPRQQALEEQAASGLLLLVVGVVPKEQARTYGIASKVFDYMMVGKPILAVCDAGPVSELIQATRSGWAVETDDIDGIKRKLDEAYDKFVKGELVSEADQSRVQKFDTEFLCGLLTKEFDRIADGGSMSSLRHGRSPGRAGR